METVTSTVVELILGGLIAGGILLIPLRYMLRHFEEDMKENKDLAVKALKQISDHEVHTAEHYVTEERCKDYRATG